MTVCIAAVCPNIDRIILVSDELLSNDYTSIEGMMKFHQIGRRWIAMVSTPDITRFPPLMRRIETLMGARTSFEALAESCEQAHAAELEKHINQGILLPYGKTRAEIVEHGLKWFGEQRHAAFLDEIGKASLGVDLLVAGFDEGGIGRMLTMRNGIVSDTTDLRYCIIGSGEFNAHGALDPIADFVFHADLAEAVYRVLAAKFAAESTPGVGTQTTAFVIAPGEPWRYMVNSDIDKIRDAWRTEGQPPVPPIARQILSEKRTFFSLGDRNP